jgi:DNA-binding CsgD family transcriptional regulator
MLNLLVYIIFIFSAAFASAAVILSVILRNRYKSAFLSTLFYYEVFIFTFGFYGIWGQVVIKAFLAAYVSPELLTRFTDISLLLGMPFLVFAWLMLIKFSGELTGRKGSNWFVFWFLLINFLIIFGLGYFMIMETGIKPAVLGRYYYVCFNILYSILASLAILFPGAGKPVIREDERRILSFSLMTVMAAQCITLIFYNEKPAVGLLFIFIFFAGNSIVPVYINYGASVSLNNEEPVKDITFDEFCRKYEVSPRESDIIREICNGLSNKEISEKLFITLQTVKDHTHRIYMKTNVTGRVQLITLIKKVKDI